jgi:alpha-ketoglutarate-dependent taurine dioxygenase
MHNYGYVHVRMGKDASVHQMEDAARSLMGLQRNSGGEYNGGGGVSRNTIQGSAWMDTSAGAPSQIPVQFHNEMAYSKQFPKHVAFAMVMQASEDGTTLLADNLHLTELLSSSLKQKLQTLGVQYIRNLNDKSQRDSPEFFTSWQDAFLTEDETTALRKGNTEESMLRRHEDGIRMVHITWCPVFYVHPDHGELYFSSILNRHGSWMDGHPTWNHMPLADRPYHCVWGDGTEFAEAELAELREVHEKSTIANRLVPGDIVVVDNLRVAHGRTAYKGKRQMGLLLSDMVPRKDQSPPEDFAKLRQACVVE